MRIELAEALLLKGELRREALPPLAADLLEAGTDTPSLRELAGLVGPELHRAHELFRRALSELDRPQLSDGQAISIVARDLAERVLDPNEDLRTLASKGARLAAVFGYPEMLLPFVRADDEYDLPALLPKRGTDKSFRRDAQQILEDTSRSAV